MVGLIQVCSRQCLLALSSIMVFRILLSPSSSASLKTTFLRLHCQLGSALFHFIFLANGGIVNEIKRQEGGEKTSDWGSGFSTCNTAARVSLVGLPTTPTEYVFLEHQGIGGCGLRSSCKGGRGSPESPFLCNSIFSLFLFQSFPHFSNGFPQGLIHLSRVNYLEWFLFFWPGYWMIQSPMKWNHGLRHFITPWKQLIYFI